MCSPFFSEYTYLFWLSLSLKWACDSDSRNPLFFTKNGRTCRHSDVSHGRLNTGEEFSFGQYVQNWCRKGFWKFRSSIPFHFWAMIGDGQGAVPPPPPPSRARVKANVCLEFAAVKTSSYYTNNTSVPWVTPECGNFQKIGSLRGRFSSHFNTCNAIEPIRQSWDNGWVCWFCRASASPSASWRQYHM